MYKILALLITSFLIVNFSYAQDTVRLSRTRLDPKSDRYKVITDRAPQVAFAEILGPGLTISLNYDRRFKKQTDGFGFRVGITPILPSEVKGSIIILGVNHLVGNNKKGRFFESGLNFTNLSLGTTTSTSSFKGSFFSATIGYRSQPVQGGFCFRAGLNPIVVDEAIIPLPYLSLGYNF